MALHFGDYRAMLYAILLQQLLYTVVSHLVAEIPYRWGWNSSSAVRVIAFGWPLLLNGMFMFAIFYGDRILVGTLFGMAELGWFAAAFSLTLAPILVLTKSLQTFFLPQLSNLQDHPREFQRLYFLAIEAGLLAGIAIAIVFAIAGPHIVLIFYGPKYVEATSLLVWLGLMQVVRLAKAGPSVVAVSLAATSSPMLANLCRVLALPLACLLVLAGGPLLTVIVIGLAGEIAGLIISLYLLREKQRLPLASLRMPLIGFGGVLLITTIYASFTQSHLFALWQMQLVLLIAGCASIFTMTNIRNSIVRLCSIR